MSEHQWLRLQSAQKARRNSSLILLDLSKNRTAGKQGVILVEEAMGGTAAEADDGASETAGRTETDKEQ